MTVPTAISECPEQGSECNVQVSFDSQSKRTENLLRDEISHRFVCWRSWCAYRYSRLSSLVLSIAAFSFAAIWDGVACWFQSQEMAARNRWHGQLPTHSCGRRHGIWSV